MIVTALEDKSFQLRVSDEELGLIGNALNEVCNGVHIDDFEFQTRLGSERGKLQQLLTQIVTAYRSVARN